MSIPAQGASLRLLWHTLGGRLSGWMKLHDRTHSWQGCGWQGRTACPWQSHSCWKRGSRSWCRQLACSAQACNLDPTLFCSLGNLRRRNSSWPLRCCNLWPCNAATSGGGTARHLVRLWRQATKKAGAGATPWKQKHHGLVQEQPGTGPPQRLGLGVCAGRCWRAFQAPQAGVTPWKQQHHRLAHEHPRSGHQLAFALAYPGWKAAWLEEAS